MLKLPNNSDSDTVELSLDGCKKCLQILSNHADTPINDLSGQILDCYQAIIQHVKLLHTTDAYPLLNNLMIQTFEQNNRHIIPGTVAAYIIGSVAENLHTGSSLHRIDESYTDLPIYWANYTAGGFDLRLINPLSDMSKSIIHVNCRNYENFPGFTSSEINKLKKDGVKSVKLHSFILDGQNYLAITDKFMELDQIKSRLESVEPQEYNTATNYTITFLVISILILLIICFVAWSWYVYK